MEGFNDVWANILEFPLLEEDKKQVQNKGDLSVSHHMIGDISAINQKDEDGKLVNTLNPEDVSKEEGQLLKEINEVFSNPATTDPQEMNIENQDAGDEQPQNVASKAEIDNKSQSAKSQTNEDGKLEREIEMHQEGEKEDSKSIKEPSDLQAVAAEVDQDNLPNSKQPVEDAAVIEDDKEDHKEHDESKESL